MTPRDLTGVLLGGRYRVTRLLGSGGMGAVYEAVQEGLGRRVAVKVVYDELALIGDAIARFQREAQAAAALGHPNIVQVTDFQLGPPPFLVMELLQGASLQEVVAKGGALPAARVVHVAAQVLSALSAAHRAGLVHRDVKPDNVFLTSTSAAADIVKLVDFGVVKQAGDPRAAQLTATGAMVGSPAYMAPEQIRGRPVDARTDLYGVGICMYNALTGRLPFNASSLPELVFAIDEKQPTPIVQLRPDVPVGLAQIVERAMAKDPNARFGSADEMLAALAPWASSFSAAQHSSPPAAAFSQPPMVAAPTYAPIHAPTYGPMHAPAAATQGAGHGSRVLLVIVAILGAAVVIAGLYNEVLVGRRPAATKPLSDAAAGDAAPLAVLAPDGSAALAAAPSASSSAGAVVVHGGGAPPSAPPAPPQEEDAGSLASSPSAGRTTLAVQAMGVYHVEHLYFVMAPLMAKVDQCAQATPSADFNQGSEVLTLTTSYTVAVDGRGSVTGIGHPTDSYSHTFDACVKPVLTAASWGKPLKPGTFILSPATRRKAH